MDPEETTDTTPAEFIEQDGDREPEGEAVVTTEEAPPEAGADVAEEPATEADDAEAAAAADGATAETDADDDAEPAPKRIPWQQKRVDKATARAAEAERQRDEALAEAQSLRELYAKPEEERAAGETNLTREQIRKEERQKIEGEAYAGRLNAAADKLYADGQAKFPKTWATRTADVGDAFSEEIKARPYFLEAVTDLDNGADVWHELAGDPDKFETILNLPPHKAGIELARLSATLAKPVPRQVSRLAAPIKPLERAVVEEAPLEDLINDPNASMDVINRRMEAAERQRYAARH